MTQEVFIALWQNREKININSSISTYIYSIARNQIYNIYRKAFYIQSYLASLFNGNEITNITEDQVYYHELKEIIEKAVENLPPKRKEVFKLSRIEGLTYKNKSLLVLIFFCFNL